MQYTLNQKNYHTFQTFAVNKLDGRSYFIPYPDRTRADAVSTKEKRYKSEKVICLNGDWDFKFYPRPAEIPPVLDTDQIQFDSIDVPSCWQFRGYAPPVYLNTRYPFRYQPPVIPTTGKTGMVFSWLGLDQGVSLRWKDPGEDYNFVGVYRRFIDIADASKQFIISFLGVASCLDFYLNGEFIGYSEGSHNTAEFDLTGKIHAGENELLAVVHRWCTGTYLECQDMFRNNGIFRDVLLRVSDRTDFMDIDAKTFKTGETYSLTLYAWTVSDTDVTFTLEGHGIHESRTVSTQDHNASVTFENLSVTQWNAEDPTLYAVYFETPSCCVKEWIGFRSIEIRKDVFLINGRRVKLHGVNHHDTSPANGYTLSPDEIERDLKLCKQYNIDTIRTSHYPPDPLFVELANEIGIYLIDENDLETHGTVSQQIPPTYHSISNNPVWKTHYVDRIARLYQRDKFHSNTCIILWSMGNEAGGYYNTDAMYDYLKEHSTLPVHYESVVHCARVAYNIAAEMYPEAKLVHDVGEHRRKQRQLNDRPYLLSEYAHAMGVGPGNIEAYWKEIYQYDNLMGGCVWEMVDHAVVHPDGSYTYGGDHGEWAHDGNFCVDGIFYPDRSPSTGAKIVRFTYRPIRVKWISGNTFELFNTTAFSPGTRYELSFRWNDGKTVTVKPDVPPLSRICLDLSAGTPVDGICTAVVTCTDTKTGTVVSEEQIVISLAVPSAPETCPLPENVRIEEGKFVCTLPDGQILVSAPEPVLLYRAATDNDTDSRFHNTMMPYFKQSERVLSCTEIPSGIRLVRLISNEKAKFTVTETYEGTPEGILVHANLHCVSGGGIIPRFGLSFRLDSSFDSVQYTGRAGESYIDMKDQFPIRTLSCTVADMTEPNIKPQESGNRCDCTAAALSNGTVSVTFKAVDQPFELAVKPYTDHALFTMKHRSDEIRTGTYVTIQAFQQGIGTASCGPATAPEYLFSTKKDYELSFLIQTESN